MGREPGRHLRYGVRMRLGWVVVAALASGCAASGADAGATDDFIDMDTPPGNCSATVGVDPCPAPDTSGSPEGGPCRNTEDCVAGTSCVAPYVDGNVGDFVCSAQCIQLMDESAWCLDSSACCDESSSCSARGLCVPGESLDDSGSSDGTTDASSSGSGASSSGGSGGSGGSSGTGSTGAATGTTGM